jgi:hypothetical protein
MIPWVLAWVAFFFWVYAVLELWGTGYYRVRCSMTRRLISQWVLWRYRREHGDGGHS